MLNTWRISWRNIIQNKKRFLLTLLAIAMGTSFITAMFVADRTTNTVFDYYEQMYVANADYWILSDEHTYSENSILPVLDDPEVAASLQAYDKQAFFELDENRSLSQASVRITGVDDQKSSLLELPVIEGQLDNEGLVLPEAVADLLNKQVGDTIRFENMGEAQVSAIVEYTQVLQSPGDWESAESSGFRIIAPLDMLREWTGDQNALSYVRFQTEGEGMALFSKLQQNYQQSNLFVQPVVADDLQSNDIGGLYTFFYITAGLAMLISGFIVYNMISTSVVERKKEFAIMKSLGYLQRSIIKMIWIETFFLAVIGTVIGVPIGVFLGDLFMQTLLGVFEFDMVYTLNWQVPVIIAVITGLIFPLLFSIIPIYSAGRTSVLSTLQTSNQQFFSKRQSIIRIAAGIMLLGAALIDHPLSFVAVVFSLILLFPFLLVGVSYLLAPIFKYFFNYPGTLASRYITRQLTRNANTGAILAAGIAVVLMIGAAVESAPDGFEQEINSSYGGDIRVTSEAAWTSEQMERLRSYDEVESVSALSEAAPVTWETKNGGTRQFSVIATEPGGPRLFTPMNEATPNMLTQKPSIILGDRAFEEWGGKVGQNIQMNTSNGTQEFEVMDQGSTSHYSGYTAFMDRQFLEETFGWSNSFDVLLETNNEADNGLRDQLWVDFGESLVEVQTVEEEVSSTSAAVSGMNELIYVMLFMIIGLASIGTANTLVMNTIERTSEIGTMRALGFTKKQVKNMILVEGILIGLSGVIGGITAGIILIYLLSVSELLDGFISFQLPIGMMLISLISGVILSLCAAWISSNSAANIDLQSSLKKG